MKKRYSTIDLVHRVPVGAVIERLPGLPGEWVKTKYGTFQNSVTGKHIGCEAIGKMCLELSIRF